MADEAHARRATVHRAIASVRTFPRLSFMLGLGAAQSGLALGSLTGFFP